MDPQQEIAQLQEKLAFLELAHSDMSDELYRQQRELTALQLAHRKLLERFEQFADDRDSDVGGVDQRPPHY
ncbi:SlyX family protein [Gammaproteobacteria bacterium LSUCC0057]|jgi:uncharacterized coiled-coil protein SlyX|uniref:SlyX family protein n=1 Tax=Gammaproteobacteria bacterium LSUCC0057 TaxID=2559237 RepID=A0A4Y8UK55_9GAMM|nr:SlyX family protein [Gammaproteobacteria bacterium LSUCC0057]